jgi:hypothetical protein
MPDDLILADRRLHKTFFAVIIQFCSPDLQESTSNLIRSHL